MVTEKNARPMMRHKTPIPPLSTAKQQRRQGVIYALCAYGIWGMMPSFFHFLKQASAYEILVHRIIWAFVFMLLLLTFTRHWDKVWAALRQRSTCLTLAITAVLIAANWLIYIWAINNAHMLEASLGYFINPLVNILLAILFLGERLRRLQWLAVTLATVGVVVQIWIFGSIPMVALGLALTFGFYGLLRKKLGVDGQSGMLLETLWLLPFALLYLLVFANSPTSDMASNPLWMNLFFVGAGILTTVPLLFFNAASARLPFSNIAFLQYLSPSLVFLQAVLIFSEPLTQDKLVTFAFIWAALGVFSLDAFLMQRNTRTDSKLPQKPPS